jgi:hypothetical protein
MEDLEDEQYVMKVCTVTGRHRRQQLKVKVRDPYYFLFDFRVMHLKNKTCNVPSRRYPTRLTYSRKSVSCLLLQSDSSNTTANNLAYISRTIPQHNHITNNAGEYLHKPNFGSDGSDSNINEQG